MQNQTLVQLEAVAVEAYVGMGGNIDDPMTHLQRALVELGALPHTRFVRRSSFYRSAPWGYADQPDFINAVAQLSTRLAPHDLLRELIAIEQRHGRERSFRNAPRPLDLDIIVYGDRVIADEALKVPHPRMAERAFVLLPLAEIVPQLCVPGLGTAAELAGACSREGIAMLNTREIGA